MQLAAVAESCKNSEIDESEAARIRAQYNESLYDAAARSKEQRLAQRDAIRARLAAKKRLANESTREQAVNDELDRITKTLVRNCQLQFMNCE